MHPKQREIDWNDLALCLAIADGGSVLAASERLGVSHSTILRRLTHLEQQLETRLFDRYPKGAKPTAAGLELIAVAREVGSQVDDLYLRVSGGNIEMRGRLRIATADQIGLIVMEEVTRFAAANPGILFDFTIAQNVKSASQSKAHLIVMLSDSPPEGHAGFRIGPVGFAPYVSRDAADRIATMPWVGHAPSLRFTQQGQLDRLLARHHPGVHTTDAISGHLNALRAGLGVGLVACGVADVDARLQRCGPVFRPRHADLWVLHRSDVARHGATRVLGRQLKEFLTNEAARLRGETPLYEPLPTPPEWLTVLPPAAGERFITFTKPASAEPGVKAGRRPRAVRALSSR